MLDLYDLYDLYDLPHVAGWEPYNLHDLGHFSCVGSALHRPCTTTGQEPDSLDRDLSGRVIFVLFFYLFVCIDSLFRHYVRSR